jgi:hypothetical protein
MAKKIIRIPAQTLPTGALSELGVCAVHGSAASTTRKRTFSTATPVWVVPLILVSLLLGLIVALVVRKQVSGPMAECSTCTSGRTRFRRLVWGGWATTVALLVASIAGNSGGLALAFLVALIVSLVLSVMGSAKQASGTLSKDQLWLELRSTHPAFDHVVSARMSAAMGQPS